MGLTFVNHRGDLISDSHMAVMRAQGLENERQKRAQAKADQTSVHKGWRVTGVKPEAFAEAKESHERLQAMARKAGGKEVKDFDEIEWRRKAKRTAVRSKPYGLHEAASLCASMAAKAGWLDVQILEVKKVVA